MVGNVDEIRIVIRCEEVESAVPQPDHFFRKGGLFVWMFHFLGEAFNRPLFVHEFRKAGLFLFGKVGVAMVERKHALKGFGSGQLFRDAASVSGG